MGALAVSDVRDNCDEPTLPLDATILRFLNRGIEEVERRLGGIFLTAPYPTVALQTYVQLNNDVQYIESLSWSSGAVNTSGYITSSSPLSQGSLVYPVTLMEQGSFMDFAAGFPALGYGPPNKALIYTDQGYAPTTTLPAPAAPVCALQTGTSTKTSLVIKLTYVNAAGETIPGSTTTQALALTQQAVVLSPQGISNATGYNVYVYDGSSTYWLQNTSPVALGTPYTIPTTPLTSGTAAPSSNTATGSGQGGSQFLQLFPPAMIGQLNIYYRARPQLWADATSTSWTNLDTSMQEAVVVWATYRTLRNRSRYDDANDYLRDFQGADGESGMIGSLKQDIMRRTRPKSSVVRDVTGLGLSGAPLWLR